MVVSGETADDPLYIPEISKVQASLQRHGVLYVGDCKILSITPLLLTSTTRIKGLIRLLSTGLQCNLVN